MKEAFKSKVSLNAANIQMMTKINDILEEYQEKSYTLTLRQLYYQLVSRSIIPNSDKEYKRISKILGEGRMAGIIDWDAIEDRLCQPKYPYYYSGVVGAIVDVHDTYRLDRHDNQNVYVEVWIEKDALSSIFYNVTVKYGIKLMVNRGYSSISAMHDAYIRFLNQDKPLYILYFGDHDPSGKDMVRDIRDRLEEFGVCPEIKPCALNMDQIEEYNPPPDPAKITDPRAKWYIKEYGNHSWELDSLDPEVLTGLVKDNIESIIDMPAHRDLLIQEDMDRKALSRIARHISNNGYEEFLS